VIGRIDEISSSLYSERIGGIIKKTLVSLDFPKNSIDRSETQKYSIADVAPGISIDFLKKNFNGSF
jgi:hypothetical protein